MGPYDKEDAARDTDSTPSEVSEAHHQAREDAQNSDNAYDRSLTNDWGRTADKDR